MSAKPPETFSIDRLETPIGLALLVTDAEGVLRALDWEDYAPRMKELLRLQYGAVILQEARAPGEMRKALTAYFKGDLDRLDTIRWRVAGTPFQQKVWHALPTVPVGTTMSYGALAAKLQAPNAMRAVGHANGSNPISVVLPCHRLIGANGALVKYGGGLSRKKWLLEHEGVVLKPAPADLPSPGGGGSTRSGGVGVTVSPPEQYPN
jgi:methylated-DNA-[protein]-cysteine S-methyltransferase